MKITSEKHYDQVVTRLIELDKESEPLVAAVEAWDNEHHPEPRKSNVETAKPTKPIVDEARWKCAGCGKEFGYTQPINFKLQLDMLELFMDWHLVSCSSAVTKA